MAVNLNLENVCRYLNRIQVGKLDGLAQSLAAKAAELGIAPAAPLAPETEMGHDPTGTIRGVLKFVDRVTVDSTKADKRKFATLLGTVQARVGAANLKLGPKAQTVDPTEGPARRRRRRRRAK